MPDIVLIVVFGILSTVALAFGGIAIFFAFRAARKPDKELAMVFWGVAALAGLTFGGMSWAYFLIPILLNNLF
jgi:heme/copper-type cytochrome/quinol oxidase subunit 3